MITRAEIEKLGALHAVEPTMLSLYLAMSRLANLTAQAGELIITAEAICGRPLAARDRSWVLEKLPPCARDGTGRTVAVFACADSGLFEAIPLPCPLPERGVLGIRPLLLARRRCPVADPLSSDVAWWSEVPARRTAATILATPPGRRPAVGLSDCLAAVSAGPVQTLVVPAHGLVRGYECGRLRHAEPRRRHLLPGLGHRGAAGAGRHRGDGQPRPGRRRRGPGSRRWLGLTGDWVLAVSCRARSVSRCERGRYGLTAIFLTSSFFSALRPMETVRMPWS
jgi:hypothetical protein